MDVIVVYKPDGTIQCEDDPPVAIEVHRDQLIEIGARRICGQGNVPGPGLVPTVCGAPTGRVNAFAIPNADWERIRSGIVGTLGFRAWIGAPFPALDIDEDCSVLGAGLAGLASPSASALPVLTRELIGRPSRCYRHGDLLTQEFQPDRVNIERDDKNRISDIWFG